jgi:hypothetical protein
LTNRLGQIDPIGRVSLTQSSILKRLKRIYIETPLTGLRQRSTNVEFIDPQMWIADRTRTIAIDHQSLYHYQHSWIIDRS